MSRLTYSDALGRYGPIFEGKWRDEDAWCALYTVPEVIAPWWLNSATQKPTQHIYMNKDMMPAMDLALQYVIRRKLIHTLDTFDGCFMVRSVRGEPQKPSTHSYALAFDLNAAKNPLGQPSNQNADLVTCFTDAGFSWGGFFHRLDPMHFSLAWE